MTIYLGGPETPERLAVRHQRYLETNADGTGRILKIVRAGDGVVVGSVLYWQSEAAGVPAFELGWGVLPEFQGRGYATRATLAAIELMRADGRYPTVHAFPGVDNAASNAVCRKAGFTNLGPVEVEFPKGHSMTCNDWRFDLGAGPDDSDSERAISPRFTDALAYAAELHARQRKKGTDVPYIAHLLGTCAIALEHGADEDAAIAALLHDAIEDQGGVTVEAAIRERFGARVAEIVRACSDSDGEPKPPWKERKLTYISHLASADRMTLLVSAADKLDNARRILADLRAAVDGGDHEAMTVWRRFKAGRDGQIWYQRALVDAFRANPEHDPRLIDELDRTVTAVRALAGVA